MRAQSEGRDLGAEIVFTGTGSIEDREQLAERLGQQADSDAPASG